MYHKTKRQFALRIYCLSNPETIKEYTRGTVRAFQKPSACQTHFVNYFQILSLPNSQQKVLSGVDRLFPNHLACEAPDAFPVVASLPILSLFFGGREATTRNASGASQATNHLNLSWKFKPFLTRSLLIMVKS